MTRELSKRAGRDEAAGSEPVERLVSAVGDVVRGKEEVVRLLVTALLARGHVLIEDLPGVGKTTLGWALARSVGGVFRRIQFTSDLLPSDILGVTVWNPERRDFEFKPGPLFANVVLADEINRTTPKTQSALLEAMSEETVSVDSRVHRLPDPFLVLATQNPAEHYGTFPLPDSQLDRFLMRVRMGYPSPEAEREILESQGRRRREEPPQVLDLEELRALQGRAEEVRVAPDISAYLVDLVGRTREWEGLEVGASPRAALDLYRAARARALMEGRDHCVPDDVKSLAPPVLAHRLVPREGAGEPERAEALLEALLETVPVPL